MSFSAYVADGCNLPAGRQRLVVDAVSEGVASWTLSHNVDIASNVLFILPEARHDLSIFPRPGATGSRTVSQVTKPGYTRLLAIYG